MKVTTHHSERRVNYVREDCAAERGSHHEQPKELVRRSAKMPNIFLHAEAEEPIQAAVLLGHLRLGLVRVYYTVDDRKKQPFKALSFHRTRLSRRRIRKKRMEKSSQAINLTGFSGSGNVIRTHDTSGMKNQNWK